jgi:predicted ATP-dependent serine protease
VKEAAALGFSSAVLPRQKVPESPEGFRCQTVENLHQAIDRLFGPVQENSD